MNGILVNLEIESTEVLFPLEIELEEPIDLELETNIIIRGGSAEYYDGPTEVTPSEDTQVLLTDELMMADNVTVNPIPQNYGRLLWNGSILTVY